MKTTMKKTWIPAVMAIGLALLLAACQVTITPTPTPEYDVAVTASAWTDATLAGAPIADTVTLTPGESIRYKVDVPSSSLEAVYYELDQPLELTVYNRFDSALASSASDDFFARGTLALANATVSGVATQDITPQLTCRGSCVIERHTDSTRYLRVHNPSAFDVTVNLYVVMRDFEDTSEGGATSAVNLGDNDGALETLGDVDVYEASVDGDVSLTFGSLASGLQYRIRIYDGGGALVDTLFVGDPAVPVFAGEEIVVDAVNGADRAAASGKSRYVIALN